MIVFIALMKEGFRTPKTLWLSILRDFSSEKMKDFAYQLAQKFGDFSELQI